MHHETIPVQLKNGSRLLVINVPNSVSIYFGSYVRSGHRFCDPKKYELPHLLEHLAFEGNKKYPDPVAFKAEVEKDGAYFNAYTNPHQNWYEYVAGPGELQNIINLAMCQIFEPLFEPQRIAQEKETVAHELERNIASDARNRGYLNFQMYIPDLYPDWPKRIQATRKTTRADILDFYTKFYGTKNVVFVAAGDFKAQQIKSIETQLNNATTAYPAGRLAKYQPHQIAAGGKVAIKTPQSPNQHHFCLSFKQPGYLEEDFPALTVLHAIFAGGMSSRIKIKSRQLGLTYSFQAGFGGSVDMTGLSMSDQTTPDKLEPLIQLAVTELVSIARGHFTDQELQRAVGFSAGALRRRVQTPANFADWYSDDFFMDRPLENPADVIAKIQSISRQDIVDAGNKYLRPNHWMLTILGDDSSETKQRLKAWINEQLQSA